MARSVVSVSIALACLVTGACDVPPEQADGVVAFREALPLPAFPLYYSGSGFFQEVGNPENTLVATYDFNMVLGVNREVARYVDREVLIFNVFDLDPSDGTDPDREYFITVDPDTGKETCVLNPFPIPNVFSRDFWLAQGLVYEGQDTISGVVADCWLGGAPEFPIRFCNRADAYPAFAPVLKKLGNFEFRDFYGEARKKQDYPASFWKLPKSCKKL